MALSLSLTIFLLVGLAGGLLLGLIGVGMALITVPLLTMTLPMFGIDAANAPLTALPTSMAIVSFGSVSSIASHHRLGNVDWHIVRTTVPVSLVGVVLGSILASHLPGAALRWIFSGFLLIIAIRMLWARDAKDSSRSEPAQTPPWTYRLAGGLIGIAGSLIGAGGGVFMVPFLRSRGHPMPTSVASSTAIGLPVSVVGAMIYALQPGPIQAGTMIGYLYLPAVAGLSLGSMLAAPTGAKLSSRIPGHVLQKGFAGLLIVLVVKMLF